MIVEQLPRLLLEVGATAALLLRTGSVPAAFTLFHEDPGTIPHHPVFGTGSVAGIAEVDGFHAEAPFAGQGQQAAHGNAAAGVVAADAVDVELFNGPAGRLIDPLGGLVIKVMAEIGADNDQRFRSAPQTLQHLGDLIGRSAADDQRHDGNVAQGYLQERQVDFQAVFLGVGGVEHLYLGQVPDSINGGLVDGHRAQGRHEGVGAAQRQALHGDPVAGAQQDDGLDGAAGG